MRTITAQALTLRKNGPHQKVFCHQRRSTFRLPCPCRARRLRQRQARARACMASMPAGGQETIRGVAHDRKVAAAQPPDDERQQNCRPACHRNKRPAPVAAPHIVLCCGGVKRLRRPFSVLKNERAIAGTGKQPTVCAATSDKIRALLVCMRDDTVALAAAFPEPQLASVHCRDGPAPSRLRV